MVYIVPTDSDKLVKKTKSSAATEVAPANTFNLKKESIIDDNKEISVSSYNKICAEIKSALENLERAKIDVEGYKKRLEELSSNVDNLINNLNVDKSNIIYANSGIYGNGIEQLKRLKKDILEYDTFVRVYNTCNKVEEVLCTDDKSNIDIQPFIDDVINKLLELSNCNNLSLDSYLKIYRVVYNIIKYEIIRTGTSVLCKNIMEKDNNKTYLSIIIEEDLKNYENNKLVNSRLNQIRSNGAFCGYVDLELIKNILYASNEKFYSNLLNTLDSGYKTLIARDEVLHNSNDEIKSSNTYLDCKYGTKSFLKNSLRKRGMVLGLITAIAITGGINVERIARKAFTTNAYFKTETTISSTDGVENIEKSEVLLSESDIAKREEIITYNDGSTKTKIATYDYVGEGLVEDYKALMIIFFILLAGGYGAYLVISIFKSVDIIEEMKKVNSQINFKKPALKETVKELKKMVQEDEYLREEYRKFYEENKYLLSEEELIKRIEKLLASENIKESNELILKYDNKKH